MCNHSANSLLSPSYLLDILTDVDQDKAKAEVAIGPMNGILWKIWKL